MGIEINGPASSGYASTPVTNINNKVSETKKMESEDPYTAMVDSYTPAEAEEDTLGLYSKKGQLYGGAELSASKATVDPELQSGEQQIPEAKMEIGQIDAERIEEAKNPS